MKNTNFKMRKVIVKELINEIRGPRHGSNEIITYDPWGEYITGVVIPQTWNTGPFPKVSNPDLENIVNTNIENNEENSSNEDIIANFNSSVIDPKYPIKSFGISFVVSDPNPKLDICATWGRYFENSNTEEVFDLNGTKRVKYPDENIWQRFSFGEIFQIEITEDESNDNTIEKYIVNKKELVIIKTLKNFETEKEISNLEDDGFIKIYIKRVRTDDNEYTISINMINDLKCSQSSNNQQPDSDKCLFQPSIRVNCDTKIESKKLKILNEIEKELNFLYKEQPTTCTGHMCSSIWKDIDYMDKFGEDEIWVDYSIRTKSNKEYEKFFKPDIRTEFIPLYPVSLPDFDLEENDYLTSDDFNAEDLANKSPKELYNTLINLHNLYKKWIDKNKEDLKDISEEDFKISANNIIKNEDKALKRIKKGLKLLRDNDLIYTSFCFANKTIALQNSWKSKNSFKWRPFQIAFFIMNLEDIFNENPESKEVLDLLWIATGGGKTESYLGIMAYTIALRRLKATQNGETGAGTTIISRYTLRLLTVQQFRRTLKMITAAELLRIDDSSEHIGWRPKYSKIKGDWIYGSTRFSTGLWVGGGVSPIHLLKEGGAIDILTDKKTQINYNKSEPAQILKCPICNSWLTVPEEGFTDEVNKLHITIKSDFGFNNIEEEFKSIYENHPKINFISISTKNHLKEYCTLSFEILGMFSRKEFEEEIIEEIDFYGYQLAHLGSFNLGYFNSFNKMKINENSINGVFDFEIWCTNPNCKLNQVHWEEGCPIHNSSKKPDYIDGNYKRNIISPFVKNTRMPIPAYLIDDHVYTRCPTVVVSTADKIARLAFEPKSGGLFGNVNQYNLYYGYNRNNLLPLHPHNKSFNAQLERTNITVKPLKAPDLIIQDELHLLDGPLGSLFGLYESMVSAIIKKQGGNPKYIASTATISNAQKQVDLLFSKKVFQFPPHGLDIKNNFFVREKDWEKSWEEELPGRLYLGIYTPGKGRMTPQVRIWSRLLKVPFDHYKYTNEENIYSNFKNYWTVLAYFNSLAELGGALALYRDDIIKRIENISVDEFRTFKEENKTELSSRNSSTELPIILDNLERDIENMPPKFDAIFTTSMFGTGVDIPHLSTMIMTGQPKTTGDYIQATGRIGRRHGGLIVDFLKAGRPRDLNHYEMFTSYHSRIYLGVEPVSVSPFSKGCLTRGLGPSLVAFLRTSSNLFENWIEDNGKPILSENAKKDTDFAKSCLEERLNNIENIDQYTKNSILTYLNECIDDWKRIASKLKDEKRSLKMKEYYFMKPEQHVVLGSSGHEYNDDLDVVYSNAPQSLRDIEDTIDFWV